MRAVQASSDGFEDSFQRHLIPEQRRALLETIARELSPDTTLGEVVDAVESLGWGEHMGELCLAELAGVLVQDDPERSSEASDHLMDAETDDAASAEAEDDADDAEHGPYHPRAEVQLREEKMAKMTAALDALTKETEAARAFSAANVQFAEHLGTQPLISVGRPGPGGDRVHASRGRSGRRRGRGCTAGPRPGCRRRATASRRRR